MRNRWCPELAAVVIGSAVVLAAAEAGAQNPPQNFVQGKCSNYRVSPTSARVLARGGSGRFQIRWDWQAPPSNGTCTFACTSNACGEVTGAVTSSASWLTASKQGVWVNYTATANTGTRSRSATVTVIGQTFTVRQAGSPPPCPPAPSVSPSSLSVGSGRGSSTVRLQEASSCRYSVRDNRTWLGVSPSTVAGNGTVTVTFTANTSSSSRSGTVRIGTRDVGLTQCPSAPSVSPSSLSVGSGRGSTTVTLQEASSCRYSVSDNRSWLGVSPSTVAGNATVTVTFTANTSSSSRSGTVRIGTRNVGLTQSPPCPSAPSVSPSSLAVGSGRGSSTVRLQEASSCRYTLSDNRGWISVSPSTVAGNGTVTVSVTANSGTSSRSGTVSIGSRSVSVSQSGTTSCPTTPSVSSSSLSFGNVSSSQTVTLQEGSGCSYSVSDNQTWITVSPSSVAGNGTVTVTVTANSGNGTRSGTVTVGGRSVGVSQSTSNGGTNQRPIANAGPDQKVAVGARVMLDGTASEDPDGDTLRYRWTRVSGPQVGLLGSLVPAESPTPHFLAPALAADADLILRLTVIDSHGTASSPDTVTITILGSVFTEHRDELLVDWSSRGRRTGNVCTDWRALHGTARDVFIWNTHRLQVTRMLGEVTALYEIYGKEPSSCGGGEYNRTFMAMTRTLHAQMVATSQESTPTTLSQWRETKDPACNWRGVFIPNSECPHEPFTGQIETEPAVPRGQIQFFVDPDRLGVTRTYRGFNAMTGRVEACGTDLIMLSRGQQCPKDRSCSGSGLYGGCATSYTDEVTLDPRAPYTRGPAGHRVTISNWLSFEMDHDYGALHHSAPACEHAGRVMKQHYSSRYGDPGWNWEPSACDNSSGFTDEVTSRTSGAVRAIHVVELRARINALRREAGLSDSTWTDPRIVTGTTPLKAVHITELRAALAAAYTAAEREAPTYTDPAIVAGSTPVRSVHFAELQAAVVAADR